VPIVFTPGFELRQQITQEFTDRFYARLGELHDPDQAECFVEASQLAARMTEEFAIQTEGRWMISIQAQPDPMDKSQLDVLISYVNRIGAGMN
jgi:hypothetical protein